MLTGRLWRKNTWILGEVHDASFFSLNMQKYFFYRLVSFYRLLMMGEPDKMQADFHI